MKKKKINDKSELYTPVAAACAEEAGNSHQEEKRAGVRMRRMRRTHECHKIKREKIVVATDRRCAEGGSLMSRRVPGTLRTLKLDYHEIAALLCLVSLCLFSFSFSYFLRAYPTRATTLSSSSSLSPFSSCPLSS